MNENMLTNDVAGVPWAAAADPAPRDTQEGKARTAKTRKRDKAIEQEPATSGGQQISESAHEIDSFA